MESNIADILKMEFEKLDVNGDAYIDMAELNSILPWHEITWIMAKFDIARDDKLDIFEFREYYNQHSSPYSKCPLRKEQDPMTKNINECSSISTCYDYEGSAGYLNSNCNENESCGSFQTAEMGLQEGCILSIYCEDTPESSLRTYLGYTLVGL